ncbi:MAG TPA: hypothetical protein PLB09_12325 [Deltaproteobacteria bacterium]|nr:hypothetical protein [Deltaproteobacteria bacterium]
MMRVLTSIRLTDTAQAIRICARWLREGLGLKVLEYRIGNAFTGSIDILAAGAGRVYLVTVNTGRLGDALLEALTAYRWYLENREFLGRVYGTEGISLTGEPVLVLLSNEYPPEIRSILLQGLKVEFRLFKYLVMGSEEAPELYVEELIPPGRSEETRVPALDEIRSELGIEQAGLSDEEIGDFLAALRAG